MYIYKTVNTLTGQYYIGKHTGNNKSYLGSGVYLKSAIAKHGRKHFKKEILQECSSRAELAEMEKYWIAYYNAVQDPNSYNIAEGGEGGWMLTPQHIEKRLENTYGKKITPPEGAVLGKNKPGNTKLCVIFKQGNPLPAFYSLQQVASIMNITYWTLWHYMKTNKFKDKDQNYFVDFAYKILYIIEGEEFTDTGSIMSKYNVSKGVLHHRCLHSERYDWWKVERVKEEYKSIGIFKK